VPYTPHFSPVWLIESFPARQAICSTPATPFSRRSLSGSSGGIREVGSEVFIGVLVLDGTVAGGWGTTVGSSSGSGAQPESNIAALPAAQRRRKARRERLDWRMKEASSLDH